MGWLFAAALGLQERRLRAVTAALGPIALGHALAVGLAVVLVGLLGLVIPQRLLLALGGAALLAVAGILAVAVYQKLGVEVLRRAWINLDFIWVGALAITGGIALGFGLWPLAGS